MSPRTTHGLPRLSQFNTTNFTGGRTKYGLLLPPVLLLLQYCWCSNHHDHDHDHDHNYYDYDHKYAYAYDHDHDHDCDYYQPYLYDYHCYYHCANAPQRTAAEPEAADEAGPKGHLRPSRQRLVLDQGCSVERMSCAPLAAA